MKALIYMVGLLAVGSAGAVAFDACLAILAYYNIAIIRPQFLWSHALPPGIEWSFYAAVCPILLAVVHVGNIGRPGREWGAAHATLAAFWVWMTASMWQARIPDIAYSSYMVNLKIFLMFFVASVLIADLRHVRWMYLMAAASVGYIGYEMNFEYLVNGYMRVRTNGFAEYDNNGAGLILAMGVPLCWFAWEGVRGYWRWLFAAMVPVLLHAVLLSFSRGAMLSLVVVTPLIVFRSRYRLATAGGVVAFGLFGLPLLAGKEVQERFLSIDKHDTDESAQSRLSTWTAAYRIACDHPLVGVGVRNSPFFVTAYGHAGGNQTIHSQYLQVAADTGFAGLALYLLFLGSVWWTVSSGRRAACRLPVSVGTPAVAWANGVEGALVVFAVGAIFLSLETLELTYIISVIGVRFGILATAMAGGRLPAAEIATD